MAKNTIPDYVFVTAQERSGSSTIDPATGLWVPGSSYVFGFLHPHAPHLKVDDERKNTQMRWAYAGITYRDDQGNWREKGISYKWDPVTRSNPPVAYDNPIPKEYAPRVWKNDAISGFEIFDVAFRDRGNKLFMVKDPRGGCF